MSDSFLIQNSLKERELYGIFFSTSLKNIPLGTPLPKSKVTGLQWNIYLVVCAGIEENINAIKKTNCYIDCDYVDLKTKGREATVSNLFVHVCHQDAQQEI
jgi:hypothetical protein